ncbi:actin depolymerizing protein [Boletus edulis BED1]|uniref:Actin depolymerizing protein n=1 Tax=Boletus edulis BED1 TaxID=1328754 RepID=A0AAD4BK69_BOLED|nr:actin depolymerizing protein [Boletus edulis BED1]
MAATSGIGVSEELAQAFSAAIETKNVRFIKVNIQNESLVPVTSVSVSGTLDDDLALLHDHLEEKVPCYVLARLDNPPSEWLVISYVPDAAQVRQKMLYASTRNALIKSLGSTVFTDSLFATDKSDVTPSGYAAHRRHQTAPKPLSTREQEMADIKAAEREAGASYEGSRARQNHLGNQEVGYTWGEDASEAVGALRAGEGSRLVVLQINASEQIVLSSNVPIDDVDALAANMPLSEPSYCLFAWEGASPNGRDIAFIYSCPSASPIKSRMVYSTGAGIIFRQARDLLGEERGFVLASRKIETSDPRELTGTFLKEELGVGNAASDGNSTLARPVSNASFARPKGPGRRR